MGKPWDWTAPENQVPLSQQTKVRLQGQMTLFTGTLTLGDMMWTYLLNHRVVNETMKEEIEVGVLGVSHQGIFFLFYPINHLREIMERGGGGYKMGKPLVRNFLRPPLPQDWVKVCCALPPPFFLRSGNLMCPSPLSIWLILQATT